MLQVTSGLNLNPKLTDLVDTADMKLIEKPQLPKLTRGSEFGVDKHSGRYRKEANMRNHRLKTPSHRKADISTQKVSSMIQVESSFLLTCGNTSSSV